MATSLQMMNGRQQATLADWARQQNNERLAILWQQLKVAISYYKPDTDDLDVATAIAARLEIVRIEIEQRGGLPEETSKPSPWYKTVEEMASWTLTDFTKLPEDNEFDPQGQVMDLLLQPLYATKEPSLSDAAEETGDCLDALFSQDHETAQSAQRNSDAANQDHTFASTNSGIITDPYEAYRVSDNDLSGLPIISCRMTFSATDVWFGKGAFPSPMQRFTLVQNCRRPPDMQAMSQQHNFQTPQTQAAKTTRQVQPVFSMKRQAPWLENGIPVPILSVPSRPFRAEQLECPISKRQKTAQLPEMLSGNSSFDVSIRKVLEKKKGKWLVEYTANTKIGPVVKTKWLTYTQARQIPQAVKDEYHKGAWQKIADKIEQDKDDT